MRQYWYPVHFSKDVPADRPIGTSILGEPLVLFRTPDGKVHCLADRCTHRSVPLSVGGMRDGHLECLYHGWQFGAEGKCKYIPTLKAGDPIPKATTVPHYPIVEKQGILWVWMGDVAKADPALIVHHPELEDPAFKSPAYARDIPVDYSLIIENVLDPSHVPFTHDGTIGKRKDAQPLTVEMVDHPRGGLKAIFRRTNGTGGDMGFTFEPPCTVRLDLTVKPGWTLVQVHHCVPLAPGKMRILSMLPRNWMMWIPDWIMRYQSNKILDQDLEMLLGQQQRLDQGARAWNCPVREDGIAARYRRWREEHENETTWFKQYTPPKRGPAAEETLSV